MRDAMRRGEPLIFQAALAHDRFRGFPDRLVRVAGGSALGPHRYVPRDVKPGKSAKPAYLLQLCAYAGLIPGGEPEGVVVAQDP